MAICYFIPFSQFLHIASMFHGHWKIFPEKRPNTTVMDLLEDYSDLYGLILFVLVVIGLIITIRQVIARERENAIGFA